MTDWVRGCRFIELTVLNSSLLGILSLQIMSLLHRMPPAKHVVWRGEIVKRNRKQKDRITMRKGSTAWSCSVLYLK